MKSGGCKCNKTESGEIDYRYRRKPGQEKNIVNTRGDWTWQNCARVLTKVRGTYIHGVVVTKALWELGGVIIKEIQPLIFSIE